MNNPLLKNMMLQTNNMQNTNTGYMKNEPIGGNYLLNAPQNSNANNLQNKNSK